MGKLVIIDGHAIMYRAFHAMPPLNTPTGEPINAVHGLVSMLIKIVLDLKPTGIVVAFDEKAPTFRNIALPTYQSQRPPMPGELSSQFAKAKEFLAAAKIPVYSMPGYEADDVIGTIATKATEIINSKLQITNESIIHNSKFRIDEVVIVTGDRDQLQLVDDKKGIKLYMPIAGLANGKLFGEAETIERMGVTPGQITDLKALIGDPSDNYKGVAGIGPVTAISLLTKYKSKNGIYVHLDEISPKVRQKLEVGKADAELSYTLATIVREVPITFDFPQMEKWNLFSPEVVNLFEEGFGFKTLTARVKKLGEEIEQKKQGSLF
jgi:DNA polymerase I